MTTRSMRSDGSPVPGGVATGPVDREHPDEPLQVFTRSPTPPAAMDASPRIVVARGFEALSRHRQALDDLAADALETNVFYESILAEPAARNLGSGRPLEFVFAYRSDPGAPQRPPQLVGFFPFERIARYRGLPISALVSFQHLHCFLCTPLVRREGASQAFAAVFDWLIGESGAPLVELRSIAADGPVHQLLVQELHARRRTFWLRDWSTRALFQRSHDAESYLHSAISGLALKEVRRKEKRLRDLGRLVWRELEPGEDARPWLSDFLRLEASGWKGRERSALACSEAAFDETYRAFSPGFLLEVENVRRLHRRSQIRWMDSCAAAEHAMINRLWPGRRTMATVLFATGRGPGDLLVSLMPLLKWGRRKLTWRPRRRARPEAIEGNSA